MRRVCARDAPGGAVSASGAGASGPGGAALERAALVLGHAAPHAGVLAAAHGPVEALLQHVTTTADRLGLGDLHQRGAGVADREEQLRVLVEAGGVVAPVHGGVLLVSS